MARKKKNIFVQIWEWLLDHGLLNAALILNLIGVIVLGMSDISKVAFRQAINIIKEFL